MLAALRSRGAPATRLRGGAAARARALTSVEGGFAGQRPQRVSEDDKKSFSSVGERREGALLNAVAQVQGPRMSLEDRFAVYAPTLDEDTLSVFGVFDGHAGARCAEYLAQNMVPLLKAAGDELREAPESTLVERFEELDKSWCHFAKKTDWHDGATAVVAVVERCEDSGAPERIWVANTGDSRAIVVRRSGKAKQMSRDHTPYLEDEYHRVYADGGFVEARRAPMAAEDDEGLLRVNGTLAMTRAFGDYTLKPYVTATPEVMPRTVRKDDMYLCLASDGLWDALDNEEVADYLLQYGTHSGAERLADLALQRGSHDNVTVLAVRLNLNDHTPVYKSAPAL